MLKSVCRGHALIALSSAESEFYCLTTAASESLGERSFTIDCCRYRRTPHLVWPLALAQAFVDVIFRHVALRVKGCGTREAIKKVHASVHASGILTKTVPIVHNAESDLNYELQIRDRQGWTGGSAWLGMQKVVLVYRAVIEDVHLHKTDVPSTTCGTQFGLESFAVGYGLGSDTDCWVAFVGKWKRF